MNSNATVARCTDYNGKSNCNSLLQQMQSNTLCTLLHFARVIAFLIGFTLYAKADTFLDTIAQLPYQQLKSDTSLYYAKDNLGNTWVRGSIDRSLINQALLLQNRSIHLADYDIYAYHQHGLQPLQKNIDGNRQPIRTRYPIYYFKPSQPTFYLNIKKSKPQELKIFINEFGLFGQTASHIVLYFSMYYGLAIMAIVFNFVFYLIFRDARFISYSLLQISIFLTFFYEDGMFYYFSDQQWLLPYFSIINTSITCLLAAVFTYYFLDLKQSMPVFRKIVVIVGCFLLISVALYTLTGRDMFKYTCMIIWFALPAFCFYQAGKMFTTNPYARFLLINFGILVLVGAGCALNRHYDITFLSVFDIQLLRLVSAIEIIAISFALIFKVRTLREENARYKTELRHYLSMLRLDKELEYEKNKIQQQSIAPIPFEGSSDRGKLMMDEIQQQYQLTEREVEVLTCIWRGDSNKEIAEKLYVSIHTVKYHVGKLYNKLDVKTRSEARLLKPMD